MGCCGDQRKSFKTASQGGSLQNAESSTNPPKTKRIKFTKLGASSQIRYLGRVPILAICANGNEYEFKTNGAVKLVDDTDIALLLSHPDFEYVS